MRRLVILCTAIAFLASGCSWAMVTKTPKKKYWDDVEYSECTRAPAAPIVDSVLGVAAVTGGLVLNKNAPDPSFDTTGLVEKSVKTTGTGISVSSLLFFGSATYGYLQTVRCNQYWKHKENQ